MQPWTRHCGFAACAGAMAFCMPVCSHSGMILLAVQGRQTIDVHFASPTHLHTDLRACQPVLHWIPQLILPCFATPNVQTSP